MLHPRLLETFIRLKSHPVFFFFNQKSLFCNSSAICFFSLGMRSFDFLFKKKKEEKERHNLLGKRQGEQGVLEDGAQLLKEIISSCDGRGCYTFRIFSAKEIEEAIKEHFQRAGISDVYKGIFVVYKGTHEDREIIIKVYRRERPQAFNEIATVTQINHGNVVKLLGCCFEMEWPILIYERVPFFLYDFIHKPNHSIQISWEHRLRIAIGVAYAITYLHIGTSRPIVHRDIKSSNILLDENYKPKLADFSLSRAIPLGETHVEVALAGTVGYIDPDCLNTNTVNEKTDVYSYGVLLLELVSGKRPFVSKGTNMDRMLCEFIKKVSTEKEERLELILGNGLSMDDRQVEQAMACIEVALGCKSINRGERPTMKEVVQRLEQIERAEAIELPPPTSSSSVLPIQHLGKYKVE